MKTSWTQGLDPDIAKEIRGDYISSKLVRNRLIKLLEEKIKESHTASVLKTGYDNPNWAYKQADNVGFERALREVVNLISDND